MGLAEQIRYVILAAQREGNRMLAASLQELGVTPSQAEVLHIISDGVSMTIKQVGEVLICEGGSPSRLIAALVEKRLLQSSSNSVDHRSILLSLTPKGEEFISQIKVKEELFYNAIGGKLKAQPGEVANMLAVLNSLIQGTRSEQALQQRGLIPNDEIA